MQTTKKAAGKKRKEEAEGARVLTDTRERERERPQTNQAAASILFRGRHASCRNANGTESVLGLYLRRRALRPVFADGA